jgi:biopolymer transport protein ExbD
MIIPTVRRERPVDWVLQFINIVFLILLFFMVNGTIASQPRPDIFPPVAIYNEAANPPQNAVFIDRDGTVSYAGRPLTPVEFETLIASAGESGDAQRVIVADRRLPASVLIGLLSTLQSKGLPVPPIVTLRALP